MRIWIILFWICLYQIESAPSIPKNIHKGNGIYYRQLDDNSAYLKLLKQQDTVLLFHKAGEIIIAQSGEAEIALSSFDTSESYWEKLNSFHNYMAIKVSKNAMDKMEESPSFRESITMTLLRNLRSYDKRFDGLLLDMRGLKSGSLMNLQSLITKLRDNDFKTGIQINLENLGASSFTKYSPSFFVFNMAPQKPGSRLRYGPKFKLAATLGRPFYLSISFNELIMEDKNLSYYEEDLLTYLENDNLVLEEENSNFGHLWRQYRVQKPFTLKKRLISAGDVLYSVEPSIEIIERVQRLAAKIPSYFFSGLIYDLNRVHPRYLLTRSVKDAKPRLDYKLDRNDNDWLLRVKISNDSLISSSRGEDAAGLGISTRGFQLLSIDLGSFENLKVQNNRGDTKYLFSLKELNALKSSSEVTLRLKPTAKTVYDGKISATAWLRPFGSRNNMFHQGELADITPLYGLTNLATPIYENASGTKQIKF